ncbi:MAG: DUF3597 domain-containing protein [Verrucomicrobiota bacterium]
MSLFKTILSKIFASRDAAQSSTPSQPTPSSPPAAPAEATPDTGRGSQNTGSSLGVGPPAPAPVDVAAVMNGLAAAHPEKLDWKRSIVDLMKLLDMDSSLASRKELAAELHYPGDTSDSAKMNLWLHQQVLKKLTENGGKVPAELLD